MAELIHQSSEVKSESPQRTQSAQSVGAMIFAVFAPSAVRLLRYPDGTSFAAHALIAFSFLFSIEKYKKPQMNADERRFVDRESAILIACNPKKKKIGGMARLLPAARALAIGVVAALVLAAHRGDGYRKKGSFRSAFQWINVLSRKGIF